MTYTDERIATEIGRVLLAPYRSGMQVRLSPDPLSGRAAVRVVAGPSAKKRPAGLRSVTGQGESPLAALFAAVHRLNERAGAIVVRVDD